LKVDDQFNLQVASHTFLGVHLKKKTRRKPNLLSLDASALLTKKTEEQIF